MSTNKGNSPAAMNALFGFRYICRNAGILDTDLRTERKAKLIVLMLKSDDSPHLRNEIKTVLRWLDSNPNRIQITKDEYLALNE